MLRIQILVEQKEATRGDRMVKEGDGCIVVALPPLGTLRAFPARNTSPNPLKKSVTFFTEIPEVWMRARRPRVKRHHHRPAWILEPDALMQDRTALPTSLHLMRPAEHPLPHHAPGRSPASVANHRAEPVGQLSAQDRVRLERRSQGRPCVSQIPWQGQERRGQRPLTFLGRLAMRLYDHGRRPALAVGRGCNALLSPETGAVLGWIDFTGFLSAADARHPADVLNGIGS
jgi:hypothetical protein